MTALIYQEFSVVVGFGLGLVLVARLLRQHDRPSVSIAWLLAIILIPYFGVPAYFLFGGRKLARRIGKKPRLFREKPKSPAEIDGMDGLERILMAAGLPPKRSGGSVEFFPSGKDAYGPLLKLIGEAKHSVHVMTFILGRDPVGREIVQLLACKAAEGVEVRLLLDALGCFASRGRFVQPIRNAGGHVGIFMPVLPLRRKWSANLRNHRKIIIVDSRAAVVGGMNLAEVYMGSKPNPKSWVDTVLRLEGPAVADLEGVFAGDWEFATDEKIPEAEVQPEKAATPPLASPSVQIAASGPDVEDDPVHDAILAACMEAKKRVWIVTPYFVPDDGIAHAIILQARLGRDVRILVPKRSDHYLADWARGPFLRRMRENGVAISLYPHKMVHAKHMIFDDGLAIAGSMNLDMRSLYLNYEIGVLLRSPGEVKTIADWIQGLIDHSVPFKGTKPGFAKGLAEDLSILVSPLL